MAGNAYLFITFVYQVDAQTIGPFQAETLRCKQATFLFF